MKGTAAAALCAVAFGCAAPAPLVHVSDGRPAMGTILEITLVTRDPEKARAAMFDRCYAETERLESIFTTWRPDGELARLNERAGRGPQPRFAGVVTDPDRCAALSRGRRAALST